MARLSVAQARRIALAAQGFADPRPTGRVDVRHFRKLFQHLGTIQLDSVNVIARTHYLVPFSRLGPYSTDAFDDYAWGSGEVFEYWGHMASLLPVEMYPLFRWRRDEFTPGSRTRSVMDEHPEYIEGVLEEVRRLGPISVSELEDPGSRTGPWWGHGKGKIALDWLFAKGRITAVRDHRFFRYYADPHDVIPPEHVDAPEPDLETAYRTLLESSARSHGVGTAADLIDYYRLHGPTARPILEAMADDGTLRRVEVEGWRGPSYLHPEAKRPRTSRGTALLSPFDSLIWFRERTERLFDFHYRIEIYVPEPQRIYGYYVLPFLLDGELVGRVDLKADRKAGRLMVRGTYAEPDVDHARVAPALAAELETMATWLGLEDVSVSQRGDLAVELRKTL